LDHRSLRGSFSAAGSSKNPPIVFIHGIRLGRHIWDDHARFLQNDFHVITLDLPGHGTLIDAALTQENVDQQLLHIFDSTLDRAAVLVGYSLGGLLAINFIQRHPERAAGLVLAGATIDVTGWKRNAYELLVAPAIVMPSKVCTRMLAFFFHLTLPRKVAKTIISTPFNYDVFEQSRDMIRDTRFSEKLRGYSNPALFVTGQFDLIFRPEQGYFAKQCGARSTIIPLTDHVVPLRRPRQFSEIVRSFTLEVQNQ